MSNKIDVFVLGANDPEMVEIEKLLDAHNQIHVYAAISKENNTAMRVFSPQAYKANTFTAHEKIHSENMYDFNYIFIECAVSCIRPKFIIDHHLPESPGYDKGPSEYWMGSAIGQLCDYLNLNITEEGQKHLNIVAAADHCLNAAYKGQCPGVDVSELFKYRIESRAKHQGITTKEVMQNIVLASAAIDEAKKIKINNETVADFTHLSNIVYKELPEASISKGVPILCKIYDRTTNRFKLNLLGASPATIEFFMKDYAIRKLKLVDIYGNPNSGYCGGFRKNKDNKVRKAKVVKKVIRKEETV